MWGFFVSDILAGIANAKQAKNQSIFYVRRYIEIKNPLFTGCVD